jgi:hypothetical protein
VSYAGAAALQGAVYARLVGDAAVQGFVGTAVLDAAPAGVPPDLYLVLGEDDMRRRGDSGGEIAEHSFRLSVFSSEASFATAKAVAAAAEAALTETALSLAHGRLVSLNLRRVRARRSRGHARRQIELIFRAVLDEI